jgi:hypothetical protein
MKYNFSFAQSEDVLRPHGNKAIGNSKVQQNAKSISTSKSSIIIGVEGGLNFNMFSQTMNGLTPNSRFAVFESGTGLSPFFGVFIDYEISNNLGFQFKLAYDNKKYSNTNDAIRDCQVVDQSNGSISIADAQVTGNYTNSVSYLDLTPQLRWDATPELFILIGPTIHLQLGKSTLEFEENISSLGECYYNYGTVNQSKTSKLSFESDATVPTRFGTQIDIGYKYPISKNILLVPKIGLQYMFSKLDADKKASDDTKLYTTGIVPFTAINKSLNSLQFSIGIWFKL